MVLARGAAAVAAAYVPGGTSQAEIIRSGPTKARPPIAMYGVVPFLFGRRGWRSVEARLDHLTDLGVDTLWLSPVTPTATGGFGYDPISYAHPRRDYGSEAEFRRMIEAIHDHGMRVILDFPTDDTSDRHPYFLDALRRGRRSPYYDYYQRDARGRPVHYFDWTNLPNLNFDNAAVRDWITSVYCHWLTDYGVDGFRMDAAWGVRHRTPRFWPECIAAIRRISPDALLIAEGSALDPYYRKAGFDCVYDWSHRVGHWAWAGAFEHPGRTAESLAPDLAATENLPISVLRFLDDNDTGARFLTRHGLAVTKLGATLLFSLEGLPAIYAGDDVGAEYKPYETEGPIDWTGRHGLFFHYRRLIALRGSRPALREGVRSGASASPGPGVLVFRRDAGAESILAAFNFARRPSHLTLAADELDVPPVDLLSGRVIPVSGAGRIEIPANGALLLADCP